MPSGGLVYFLFSAMRVEERQNTTLQLTKYILLVHGPLPPEFYTTQLLVSYPGFSR